MGIADDIKNFNFPVSWTARVMLLNHFTAFIFGAVSLLSPYWYMEDPHNKIGLWAKCKRDRWDCTWAHEDDLFWERIQPQWFVVCQVLMACAVATQIFTLFIFIYINFVGTTRLIVRWINWFFIIITLVEILATVAHFGHNANRERGVVINKHAFRHFGWAYLLAIMSMIFQIFDIPLYILWTRRRQRRKDILRNSSKGPIPEYHPMQTFPQQQPGYPPSSSGYGPPPQQQYLQQQQYYQQQQQQQQPLQQQHPGYRY